MLDRRSFGSLLIALGLVLGCSKPEPVESVARDEDELAAAAGAGPGGCASDADCPPGNCWQCNLSTNPGTCEPRTGQVCLAASPAVCDADDLCDASGNCVPTFAPASKTCANESGGCEANDHCSGTDLTCVEVYAAPSTPCGDPTNAPCNGPDTCNGAGQCQANLANAGALCGDQTDTTCNGRNRCNSSGQCLDNFATTGTLCGDQTNTQCNGRNTCDGAGACLENFTSSGTNCGSSVENDCNHQDQCDGSGNCDSRLEPANTRCGDQTTTTCTLPNTCDGTGVCLENHASGATPCNVGLVCTVGDHCSAGVCVRGTPTNSLCGPPNCSDLSVPGCCAQWYCDVTDTDPVSRGCKSQPFAPGTTACRPSRFSCDAPELCDGTVNCPADLPRPAGFECAAAECNGSEARPQVTCDGSAYTCATQPTCDPFTCNADASACRTRCSSSAQCLDAFYCDTRTGRCEPRTPGGEPCDDASVCATPYCVDGVCCDAACEGQCEACAVRGREGVCSPLPDGSDPADFDNEPCDTDGSVCGGACDGRATDACVYPTRSTECADAACDAVRNEGVDASFCDGSGACVVEEPVSCSPYACGGDACNGDCNVDADCNGVSFCRAGICEPRRDDGGSCSRAAQCRSGFCVDGTCCESACDGQCETCENGGVCAPVSGAPVGERPACAGSGDCRGVCDGAKRDACAFPGREVTCRDAFCESGEATVGATCDGRGACPVAETIDCPKGCEGAVCGGDECVVDRDCASGSRCAAGRCVPGRSLGASCGRSGDCASGHCTDGVCCERACLGQCEACDVSENEGRCVAVPEGEAPHGARPQCNSDGSVCGGVCDGVATEGCGYADGTVCREASCRLSGARSIATLEARCSGTGRCPAAEEQSCPGACASSGALCDGDCDDDPGACANGYQCSGGVCVPEKPAGGSCTSAMQCASGHCVDGVCCETACDGQCEACDVSGSLGVCSPVSGAPHAGRPACAGTGACSAECDGTRRSSCVFPDGRRCGPESCSNGAYSDEQTCSDEGECLEARVTACLGLSCVGSECGTGCTSDADCTGDNVCSLGECQAELELDAVDRGSCGCRVPGRRSNGAGALVLAAAFVLALSGRRFLGAR